MAVKSAKAQFKTWNLEHYKRLAKYNARIEKLLNQAIANATGIVSRHGVEASDKPFSFSDDRQVKAEADKIMKELSREITALTQQAEGEEWKRAYEQSVGYIGELYKVALQSKYLQDEYAERLVGMKARNLDALGAFQKRKIGGMNLSGRIWEYTEDFQRQMEVSIDTALLEGKSAHKLALSVQELLKNPDALFRRVRDENDELRMSKAMEAYHPGPGRYRSAYKNAMRLARSEINMAYRASDSQTAQEFDCVVGIRVNLSNNHTCNGEPFVDICDELSDQNYPKDFVFTGWHPQCRCFITYILKTDDEFWADLEADENNESVNTVHDVPDAFKEWVGKNEERIARAKERGTLPYFLRDNGEVKDGKYELKHFSETNQEEIILSPNMPTGLTEEQQKSWLENERIVAEKLGIDRGEQMSFEEADQLRGNPHFNGKPSDGYTTNCQTCVVAHEMRRRGFNVEACPNLKLDGNVPYDLSHDITKAWIDPKTGKHPTKINLNTDDRLSFLSSLDTATREHGRYQLRWGWEKESGGHTILVERTKDGHLIFFDPQDGVKGTQFSINGKRNVQIFRIDTLMPNTSIIDGVVAKAGTTKTYKKELNEYKFLTGYYKSYQRMLKEGRSKDDIKELFESWGYSKTQLKKLWNYIEKQEANKDVVTGGLDRDKAAGLLEWAKANLIGKKTFEHPDFNGKVAKFVRNSITENSSYGELFELKSEILRNIDDYLTKDLTFAYEEPVKGKMRGFYKATTSYKGEINEFKGRTIELQFAINPSQELVFYFIKLI